jgi:hypothetical protein
MFRCLGVGAVEYPCVNLRLLGDFLLNGSCRR